MALDEKVDNTKKCAGKIKAQAEEDVSSGHTCGVCGRSFPLLSSLSQHMRRHTREKPYKCPYCEHRTAQKGSLKAHVRSHKLGLLTQSPIDKEGDGDQEMKDIAAELPPPPEMDKTTDKKHNVNGKVKKKAAAKKVKSQDVDGDDSGALTCTVCSQVFLQVLQLKTHMKSHPSAQDHGCKICGRRFRQAWFLQSHMRIHRVKAQTKNGKDILPATINGVPQDPVSLINDECQYELCASCGNFFPDLKTLQAHEKLHWLNQTHNHKLCLPEEDGEVSDMDSAKKQLMKSLNLTSAGIKENTEDKSQGKRIVELDPVCSYQAWHLATRGRLVDVTDKGLGWDKSLADAEVVYDMEKGEYVPLKQGKKRKQTDNPSSRVKKKKTETDLCSSKTVDKRISQDRILLNGLGHAFYEALQAKKVKDTNSSAKASSKSQELEGKPQSTHTVRDTKPVIFCEHCDFHTVDASLLRSHLLKTHQDVLQTEMTTSSKSSRYMDYLRMRSALLSQSYWNPYTYTPVPGSSEAQNVKTEKQNSSEVKGEPGTILDLSVVKGNTVTSVKSEGLVKNQCPYCSHTSNFPEVLWIHQRVAHKVDGSSTLAPKWAPCPISFKSLKAGSAPRRRTGPPPFLEGKDCPALLPPRTQRTQAPRSTARSSGRSSTSSNSSSKNSGPKSQSTVPKPKSTLPKDSRSVDETGRAAPQKTSTLKGNKGATSSAAVGQSKSTASAQSSPKHRSHRVKGNLPQEGLGLMLDRNHHSSTSSNSNRLLSQRPPCDPTSGLKGQDPWAALNLWGLHGNKAYLDPLLFAQGKGESTGQMPMDINILSLLKNYSPHDLAALYQHWGFVDPRLDPQAMLQLNEHYANEIHSSTEGSKQVNSHSAPSGSFHKGT
ncbi:zinc finger protein 516-like [Eucyclogobius newberryi]|uniref:zinc finger protein 516-like n=1 Tax=Eucyclogobius newberryi TaxID=166745 RepID=UPI003B5C6E49